MHGSVFFARHGQTADNANGLILGRRDPPLSRCGIAQAERLGAAVWDAGLARLWTSPLRRAIETAEIVARHTGLAPSVLAELVESDRGLWEGRAAATLADEAPELWDAFVAAQPDFAFPDGESLRGQIERTSAALEIIRRHPLPALVVAHAGTIRAAFALVGAAMPPEANLAHGEIALSLPPADCLPPDSGAVS